ncbi:MAG: DUF1440 domain-containing protein [Anaerolineae bacterium]|jgi:uncharacterized membrane protein YagU involved in acid resistance|nr:DUF1440 domain-containing protein [Anaerolineae bacterium]
MTTQTLSATGLSRPVIASLIGGVAGGIAFGVMMGLQGMLPMVGMLIGQDSPVIGFVVHMVISLLIAAPFGLIVTRLPQGWPVTIGVGVVYGAIWWVLGALILMPLMLGMNQMVLVIGDMQWMSLIGHGIYGVILAGVAKFQLQRA